MFHHLCEHGIIHGECLSEFALPLIGEFSLWTRDDWCFWFLLLQSLSTRLQSTAGSKELKVPVSSLCSSSCVSEYDATTQSIKLTMQNGRLAMSGKHWEAIRTGCRLLLGFCSVLHFLTFCPIPGDFGGILVLFQVRSRQGSGADCAGLVLVPSANDLLGRSQLRSAHPAPRQPQLHRGLGNQVPWREGPSPLAVNCWYCWRTVRQWTFVIPWILWISVGKNRKRLPITQSLLDSALCVLWAGWSPPAPYRSSSSPLASRTLRSPSLPGLTSVIGPCWTGSWRPTHRWGGGVWNPFFQCRIRRSSIGLLISDTSRSFDSVKLVI